MNRRIKFTLFTLILIVGSFFMVSCGEKDEDKSVQFDFCNETNKTIAFVNLIDVENPEEVDNVLEDVKTKESKEFDLDSEDSKGKYLFQIKFKDDDFVYTSAEASLDGVTKIKLSDKDGKVVLETYKGDEKIDVFLEQPAIDSEETVSESVEAQVQQEEPVPIEPTAPAAPQPSEPSESPSEKPQQDGCLNDALFN